MSELQNDSVESEAIETAEVEDQDNGADLAPASEAEHEEQPQVDEEAVKQEAINKKINKKHFEAEQAKREAAEYKRKLEAFESKQREELAAKVKDIPPMPDAFDDDFDEKVKQRDQAILKKAEFDAQQGFYAQQQQLRQQQEAQAKQKQIQDSVVSYSQKANELGIKQEELQSAATTVASYGLSDDLVMHILGDSQGPLITKHLAANPQDGYQLASMSPYDVGRFIDDIKQKASALKPNRTKAPKPATNLQGNGVDPEMGKYKNIKGATFN